MKSLVYIRINRRDLYFVWDNEVNFPITSAINIEKMVAKLCNQYNYNRGTALDACRGAFNKGPNLIISLAKKTPFTHQELVNSIA